MVKALSEPNNVNYKNRHYLRYYAVPLILLLYRKYKLFISFLCYCKVKFNNIKLIIKVFDLYF